MMYEIVIKEKALESAGRLKKKTERISSYLRSRIKDLRKGRGGKTTLLGTVIAFT